MLRVGTDDNLYIGGSSYAVGGHIFINQSSGNIGIGTTSPTSTLHVYGTTQVYAGSSGNSPALILGGETGAPKKCIFLENYWMVYQGHDNEGHKFRSVSAVGASTDDMVITGSGNIGIGTTSPDRKVVIDGGSSTDAYLKLSISTSNASYASGILFNNPSNSDGYCYLRLNGNTSDLTLAVGASERVRFSSNGNVGIGNSSPSSTLYVQGTTTVTDSLSIGSMANARTGTAAGTYTAGTWYEIASSSNLTEGVYIVIAYVDTFNAGGGFYYMQFASVPFYFYPTYSNGPESYELPAMIGTGHAANGEAPPAIRVRQTYSGNGTFVEMKPASTWSGLNGTAGRSVTFMLRRIA